MPVQVDYWAGDAHEKHVDTKLYDNYYEALIDIAGACEVGMLCNILHTDFRTPEGRAREELDKVVKNLGFHLIPLRP